MSFQTLNRMLYGWSVDLLFYGPVNTLRSCRARSVILSTLFLGTHKRLSADTVLVLVFPVLFLVFINDLPDVIEVLVKLFADDAKIYAVVPNTNDNRVQYSLNRAADWANVWKMLFNIIKCHHLHIGKHDTGITCTMISNNQEVTEKEKSLGVIIDQNLT